MSERIPPPIMKTTCVWHSRCLVLLAAACIHPTLHAQWTQSSVVSATVSSYDLTLDNGTTTVAYESAGNIYVASKGYLAAEWSSPQLVGAGAKPSVVMAAGGPVVAYMSGSNVMVSSRAGSNWDTVNLGAVNGSIRAMLRMDGAGTLYLLTEGSGTSGRGSLDIATNSGGGWGAFTNLYYGWYDSGSGAYYHQGVRPPHPMRPVTGWHTNGIHGEGRYLTRPSISPPAVSLRTLRPVTVGTPWAPLPPAVWLTPVRQAYSDTPSVAPDTSRYSTVHRGVPPHHWAPWARWRFRRTAESTRFMTRAVFCANLTAPLQPTSCMNRPPSAATRRCFTAAAMPTACRTICCLPMGAASWFI